MEVPKVAIVQYYYGIYVASRIIMQYGLINLLMRQI